MRWGVYAATLALLAVTALSVDWGRLYDALFDWDIAKQLFPDVLTVAAKNTLIFTTLGFVGALLLGLLLALMRLSSAKPYRWFAAGYIEVFRGIPALVTIVLIGFGLPIALGVRVPGIYGPGALALSVVYGAYLAETIRAGIEAIPKGQMEAARSLGMSHVRAMVTIVIPQAFRVIIPPLTNEFVALLKDTSLISVLGVTAATLELTRFGRSAVNTYANATPLIVVGVVYLVLTVPLTRLAGYLEKRSRRAR